MCVCVTCSFQSVLVMYSFSATFSPLKRLAASLLERAVRGGLSDSLLTPSVLCIIYNILYNILYDILYIKHHYKGALYIMAHFNSEHFVRRDRRYLPVLVYVLLLCELLGVFERGRCCGVLGGCSALATPRMP